MPTPTLKPKPPKLTEHVILITISGLRGDCVADPVSCRVSAPTLQAMLAKGVFTATLESVYPTQTLPAHASLATGMLPVDHNVTADAPFAAAAELPQSKETPAAKSEMIWEAARREGLKVTAIGWPLFSEAAAPQPSDKKPKELFAAALKQDQERAAQAAETLAKVRPNLLLLNFGAFAFAQENFGLPSAEAAAALQMIDEQLNQLREASQRAGMNATFLIVSERGAARAEREFNPNVLLAKKGWLTVDAQGAITSWRAIAQTMGGSAAIFVKNPAEEKALEKLLQEQHAMPDSPIWRVINRQAAARLGADARPAFFLEAAPGFAFGERARGSLADKITLKFPAGYLPQRAEMRGFLVANGKGIRENLKIEYARLIDLAPTIARLLGLELRARRGRALTEIIVSEPIKTQLR
jgi:predicted AlkP superfamily pyrophosphatase or phosphodiesterase